ncbi:glycosyltransferase [Cellulomonas persica]|uniref:Glycosyltransferase 2-like domain-containing protein n=1 Tax=Cellulomonas persica TaxID=76861 RepID=A0A510UWJ6_9CELL|nr:glycosyltransferase [Cellulomonas persica]GEK19057.1 hypothetical protein CPE01_27900 [Cellulomonas persica]
MSVPQVLVVVPAHDEERVIARCVRSLLAADGVRVRVVVVANGCSDATAQRVRDLDDPRVTLVDLPTGGKANAVRAGLAHASHDDDVVAVVDADVVLDDAALPGLACALAGASPLISAPALALDLSACSWGVRRYYAAWLHEPHVRSGDIGARGVYAVNRAGLPRLADLPDVIADDGWARAVFAPHERVVSPGTSTVRPPRTLRAQVRRRARIIAGGHELARVLPVERRPAARPDAPPRRPPRTLRSRLADDGLVGTAVWYAVELPARAIDRRHRRRGSATPWGRDATTR